MIKLDYYFNYKNTYRFLLISKLGNIKNTYNIPKIKKVTFFFYFNKIEDLDDLQLYNSFYFFKFFLGKKAFFTKTYSIYSLGKWSYKFSIQVILNKSFDIFNLIYYLSNNILLLLDNSMLKKGYLVKKNLYYIKINDMKSFSEIKTNLGLFHLNTSININLYLIGGNITNSSENVFIKLLKI